MKCFYANCNLDADIEITFSQLRGTVVCDNHIENVMNKFPLLWERTQEERIKGGLIKLIAAD